MDLHSTFTLFHSLQILRTELEIQKKWTSKVRATASFAALELRLNAVKDIFQQQITYLEDQAQSIEFLIPQLRLPHAGYEDSLRNHAKLCRNFNDLAKSHLSRCETHFQDALVMLEQKPGFVKSQHCCCLKS